MDKVKNFFKKIGSFFKKLGSLIYRARAIITKVLVLLSLFIVYWQIYVAFNYDAQDVMVFVNSLVILGLTILNLVYNIVLYVKNGAAEREAGDKTSKYNLIVSSVAVLLSAISFIIAMTSYLYLIWYI